MNMQFAVDGRKRPTVLLCATMWWPLAARLAMAFLRHGCDVVAICPPGHPLRFVTGIERLYLYKGFDSVSSLKAAILKSNPDLIVPCDDGVVWQLHELHAKHPGLQPLIEKSIGSAEVFPIIRSRETFLHTARALGVRVPITQSVAAPSDLARWYEDRDKAGVLKLDGTWGGTGVVIARSQAEALSAFHRFSIPMSATLAWKRWLVNRDPLALWSWRKRETPSVTIQQFIEGTPANTMFACWQGEILAIVTVEVITSQGATGAATVVRLVKNAEIESAAKLIARRLQLNGFHGLDFILDKQSGAPYLIELNPRCTQLGHLPLPSQGDLAGYISAKLQGEPQQISEDSIQGDTVAFFPQTFTWNPKSEFLKHGYHDVPWEEPALFKELLRDRWPDRQAPARVYHSVRAKRKEKEVRF